MRGNQSKQKWFLPLAEAAKKPSYKKRKIFVYIRILEAYEQNKVRYGSPRIYRTLRSWGVICYKNQVATNIGYILLMVICRRLTMKGRNYLNFFVQNIGGTPLNNLGKKSQIHLLF